MNGDDYAPESDEATRRHGPSYAGFQPLPWLGTEGRENGDQKMRENHDRKAEDGHGQPSYLAASEMGRLFAQIIDFDGQGALFPIYASKLV